MNGLVNDGMCMQILCCQQGGIKKGFPFKNRKICKLLLQKKIIFFSWNQFSPKATAK